MTSSNKRLRFCSFLLLFVITLGLLLGSSVVAYADSDFITINGVNCVPITLTTDMIVSMFESGSAYLGLTASTSANISLFDMVNGSSSVVTIGTDTTMYTLTDVDVVSAGDSGDWLNFSADYSYNLRVNESSTLTQYYYLSLPFEFYLHNYSFKLMFYYSGLSNDQDTQLGVQMYYSDNSSEVVSTSATRRIQYWRGSSLTRRWAQKFSYIPNGYVLNSVENEGIRTAYSIGTLSNISSDNLIDHIAFWCRSTSAHADGTGWNYFFCAPMMLSVQFGSTVYVPVEFEEQVLEYLDLITGDPTAANQHRIDELTNEFQQKQQDLSDLTEDLTVDVPDITGTIGSIPEDAQSGANDFGTYIFTPIYNIPLVQILVACAFGFAVIKLVLYGSGAS